MRIKDFSQLEVRGFFSQFMEVRVDYNGGASPVYVGYNQIPNAGEDAPTWYIIKLQYDGSDNFIYQQLPVNGVRFAYIWNDRSSYF
jgi:hypothetical protein